MLKPSFDIVAENQDVAELRRSQLLLEISPSSFSYLFYDRSSHTLRALKHFPIEFMSERSLSESISQILQSESLLQEDIREAVVVYNFPESNLVPAKFFDISISKPVTELIFGSVQRGLVLSERVPSWDIYNCYRIPRDIHSLIQKEFTAGKYWHFYSLLLAGVESQSLPECEYLKLVFYPDRFILALFHQQQLHLVNSYTYQTPDDAVYFVLAALKQLNMSPSNAVLVVAGLIDEQSPLYAELLKYFINVNLEALPDEIDTKGLFDYFPGHYFSPILRSLLCV